MKAILLKKKRGGEREGEGGGREKVQTNGPHLFGQTKPHCKLSDTPRKEGLKVLFIIRQYRLREAS